MGYSDTHRRAVSVSIHGNAYSERDLIGVAYVIEQATKLRKPASELNPSMYRCAKTVPAPPYAERGGCNPDYDSLKSIVASAPKLAFSLETESVAGLQARMAAGTLTAQRLTRAYLARIALTNAEGPSIQAVRDVAGPQRARRGGQARRRAQAGQGPRPAARHPRAGRRHDRRARAADDGRLDRAAALQAGEGREARRQAQGGRARSSSARRTSPSSAACSTTTRRTATRRSAARSCCRPTPTRRRRARPRARRPRRRRGWRR